MAKQTKKLANGNGHLDPSKLTIGGKVGLTPGEQEALRKLDNAALQIKIELANIEIQISHLNKSKAKLLEALEQQANAIREQATAICRSHGIDPENKSKGWSVNLQQQAIVRTV